MISISMPFYNAADHSNSLLILLTICKLFFLKFLFAMLLTIFPATWSQALFDTCVGLVS